MITPGQSYSMRPNLFRQIRAFFFVSHFWVPHFGGSNCYGHYIFVRYVKDGTDNRASECPNVEIKVSDLPNENGSEYLVKEAVKVVSQTIGSKSDE